LYFFLKKFRILRGDLTHMNDSAEGGYGKMRDERECITLPGTVPVSYGGSSDYAEIRRLYLLHRSS
jgi:hypothetical protein